MTVILGGIACGVVLLLAGFAAQLGEITGLRARAQLAADAAALAAVAESAVYGEGEPRAVAARFSELNGARLVSCVCPPGGTDARVAVAVAGVRARARAVLDPAFLAPADVTFDAVGLHPTLAAAVRELVAVSGGRVRVVSGFRSKDRQSQLWSDALARYGSAEVADDWVARPGRSMHERGLAVDLGGDLVLATRLIGERHLPLYRPLPNEPWHFELIGSRAG
jgi:hypothetical protein